MKDMRCDVVVGVVVCDDCDVFGYGVFLVVLDLMVCGIGILVFFFWVDWFFVWVGCEVFWEFIWGFG